MRYPSVKTIETRLNIDRQTAKTVRGLIDGSIAPDTIPATAAWHRQCYGTPHADESILHAVDSVLENYGVEPLGETLSARYRYAPQYSYSNSGDTYAATIILDNETGQYMVADIGYLVESGKVRGS